jgi:hypothetical protein
MAFANEELLMMIKFDFVSTLIHYGIETEVAREFARSFLEQIRAKQPVMILKEKEYARSSRKEASKAPSPAGWYSCNVKIHAGNVDHCANHGTAEEAQCCAIICIALVRDAGKTFDEAALILHPELKDVVAATGGTDGTH